MSARGEELSRRIEQGADALLAGVRGLSDAEWATVCPDEQRSVGMLVYHVGAAYPEEAEIITALVNNGGIADLTWSART
jgi:hypothetical protein